jgi:hypothetical protein
MALLTSAVIVRQTANANGRFDLIATKPGLGIGKQTNLGETNILGRTWACRQLLCDAISG